MALAALGARLSSALAKLGKAADVDDELVKATLKEICSALLEADVAVKLVAQLRNAVSSRVALEGDSGSFNKAKIIERAVVDELVRMLDPGKAPFKLKKGKPNVVMFVGLQGAGKTTTVAKYAHYYQSRKWKVAMVCADTFRAGAFDQLKQNATRVRVPFYGSYTETDPVAIAAAGVEQFKKEGYELIIVDTSGRHKQETSLFEEMVQVQLAVKPDDIIFTMDSTIGQAAYGQAEAFKKAVPVGSVIITKLDGHARGGGALSAVAATGSPVIFIGTGEHFDDLATFEPERFISKLLGRGDIKGLMSEFKDKGIMENSEEMMNRITSGNKFTYDDLKEQLQSVMKLGPLSKVMEMMPGGIGQMLNANLPPGQDSNAHFKRSMVIMDSMSKKEMACKVPMDEKRVFRIANGAGVHPQEVEKLMQMHAQFAKMITGMSKSGLLKGTDAQLSSKIGRNPNAVMSQLQKAIDPKMLQQMGGAGNFMEMLKQMGGGAGGDMGKKMGDMMKGMFQ